MRSTTLVRCIPFAIIGTLFLLTSCSPATTTPTTDPFDLTSTAGMPPEPTGPSNTDGAETIFIPGGTYPVGSSLDDPDALPGEMPQHDVTLTGYYIFTHEVTNEMYQACVTAGTCPAADPLPEEMFDYASNPSFAPFPVVNVDWNMADTYCEWAGGRLPTEAEWEVAARGESGNIYPWGDELPTCDNAGFRDCAGGVPLPFMAGYFALGNSPWGVWDMAGNVWEWTNDWFEPSPYTSERVTNPIGPWNGEYKVLHGGGWNSSAVSLRSAMRAGTSPSDAYWDVGFRCVANSLPVPEGIASTDGGHTVRESGGGPVEGGGESGGRFTLGPARAVCTPDTMAPGYFLNVGMMIFETPSPFLVMQVNDERVEIMSSPGAIPGLFTRSFPFPSLPEGSPVNVRVYAVNLDGSPIPWATASFVIPTPAPCSPTSSMPAWHAAEITCEESTPGEPRIPILHIWTDRTAPVAFEQISVNGTPKLFDNVGIYTGVWLPDMAAGPASVRLVGTSGTARYDWTENLTIPDCSSSAGRPEFTLTPSCNGAGGYTVDIQVTPANFPIQNFEMNDTTRFGSRQTGTGQYRILNVPAEVFSPAGGFITIWAVSPPGTMIGGSEAPAQMLFMPEAPTCPEVPSSGDWNLRVVCDTYNPDSGNVWAAVDHPGDLTGLTWATMGGETNFVNMFSSGDPTPFRDYFDVSPIATGAFRVCIDPSGMGRLSSAVCHTFDNFEALRTAAACAPAGDEWAMQITCASESPTEAYDIRLTYPSSYTASNCNVIRMRGGSMGGIGGNVDPATHSCVATSLPKRFLNASDSLFLTFNTPDGNLIGHDLGDIGGSLPSCGGDSGGEPTGGDWWWEVICNPEHVRPGWIEFRAHVPPSSTDWRAFGEARRCSLGGNPGAGTISQFCAPGTDLGAPMPFWVLLNDGTILQHTFTNAAELAATCPNRRTAPEVNVGASCSTSYFGTYDLDIQYTPPDYEIYAIYDEIGQVLTQCDVCSAGHCLCRGVATSPDGLIHINVDDRTGPTEVLYPQVIAPPSCNGQSTGGWGLSAACSAINTDTIDLTITYPTTLGIMPIVINDQPGWACTMSDLSGSGNRINCVVPLLYRYGGPLTWEFTGPAPEHAIIHHTFTEYELVVPTTCEGGSTNGWSIGNPRCHLNGSLVLMNIFYPSTLAPFTTLNVTAGSITFTCTDMRTSIPYRLACWGARTASPASLQISYTSGGVSNTMTIPEWQTQAPRTCPTPVPGGTTPQPPPPAACSSYDNGLDCGNAGCYWWNNMSCHPDTDPCRAHDGDDTGCAAAACFWDVKDDTCHTP